MVQQFDNFKKKQPPNYLFLVGNYLQVTSAEEP